MRTSDSTLVSKLIVLSQVGGRPPVGGKAGTKGEWTIGGLVLPVPGDMRRASNVDAYPLSTYITYRVSTRSHQRSSYEHTSFLIASGVLSWN